MSCARSLLLRSHIWTRAETRNSPFKGEVSQDRLDLAGIYWPTPASARGPWTTWSLLLLTPVRRLPPAEAIFKSEFFFCCSTFFLIVIFSSSFKPSWLGFGSSPARWSSSWSRAAPEPSRPAPRARRWSLCAPSSPGPARRSSGTQSRFWGPTWSDPPLRYSCSSSRAPFSACLFALNSFL